ncbi:AAA family ATPase [Vibrio sp. HS-50-1]|uniref:AAA family ATPase n=1 Tax=Vibrio TaxID=662 RepID=UPI00084A8FF0|nr:MULTISPECIES: AAA family ATPase [Vibrio]MCS0205207.1 AAA family ATPase [Vibrio sp. HS-50-1]ODW50025.1 hypothetical protein BBL88_17930 [Vibrio parahaemolyticus]
MKIESLIIHGLHGTDRVLNIKFFDDVNIITGSNGVGKTTVLKSVWYIISGNIERLLQEVRFESLKLVTNKYTFLIDTIIAKNNKFVFALSIKGMDGETIYTKQVTEDRLELANEANKKVITLSERSIYFPTFRRIEGGYTITSNAGNTNYSKYLRNRFPIESVLDDISKEISVDGHKFVSSVSTKDIKSLISQLFSEANDQSGKLTKEMIDKILTLTENRDVMAKKDSISDFLSANESLEYISESVRIFKQRREEAFGAINYLSDLVSTIFKHSGINFNENFTLGCSVDAIDSDALSSGEKQMLSFLCYNMVYTNCPFFIDEPELSLHIDWQRLLLSLMLRQKSNNQFIIATHSPFIYTLFEDKEVIIGGN